MTPSSPSTIIDDDSWSSGVEELPVPLGSGITLLRLLRDGGWAYLVHLLVPPKFVYLVASVADGVVLGWVFVARILEFEVVEGGLDLIQVVLSVSVADDGQRHGFRRGLRPGCEYLGSLGFLGYSPLC